MDLCKLLTKPTLSNLAYFYIRIIYIILLRHNIYIIHIVSNKCLVTMWRFEQPFTCSFSHMTRLNNIISCV